MALNRVSTLEDLTLWDLCPSAIGLLSFYKKLLTWCDCIDSIHPTPPTEVVEFLERCDDTSNAPLPGLERLVSNNPCKDTKKRSRKCVGSNLCVSEAKNICLTPSALGNLMYKPSIPLLCVQKHSMFCKLYNCCWVGGHPMC